MSRDAIIREARGWIGTPYRHQAATKGAGCDCLGLLRGVWRSVYGAEPEIAPPYTPDWDEVEGREVLLAAAGRHLVARPLSRVASGDVLIFRMQAGRVAKHVGLYEGGSLPRFVHAYSGRGVVASPLSAPWRRRIAGVFSFPGVD